MDTTVIAIIIRSVLDIVGLSLIGLVIYVGVYCVRKYMLNCWVKRAVSAAEITFRSPGQSKEKKEWVLSFLVENNLTNNLSDDLVDTLIEAAVNDMNIQQGKIKKKPMPKTSGRTAVKSTKVAAKAASVKKSKTA